MMIWKRKGEGREYISQATRMAILRLQGLLRGVGSPPLFFFLALSHETTIDLTRGIEKGERGQIKGRDQPVRPLPFHFQRCKRPNVCRARGTIKNMQY